MKGDFSRFSHDLKKHYTTILKQQGRVALDADWNEYVEMRDDLERTQAQDVIGACGVPKSNGGFMIDFKDPSTPDLTIAAGHLYVDGLLCKLEQPLTYMTQPDYPTPLALEPSEGRTDLVYLDVWQRHITAIEDPEIREKALGGPDTTTRLKTIWQVKIIKNVGQVSTCKAEIPSWPPLPSGGHLSTNVVESTSPKDPCLIATDSGYRGLENRLYRVEIHDAQIPTFKWSRDNGAMVFPIEFISGKPNTIKLLHSVPDGFQILNKGDWVEISDDQTELSGRPGLLTKIQECDSTQRTITLQNNDNVSAYSQKSHPKIRQWNSGAMRMTNTWIELETGIQIRFSGTPWQCGDYWVFTARTANQEIEMLTEALPRGIAHGYCKLALVTWKKVGEQWDQNPKNIQDCRPDFPPLTDIWAEDVRFKNDACQLPDTKTVQEALDRLCAERDFRHHNKHLHGWGIVCGLQVMCHPREENNCHREEVIVREGYAIDCEGNDIYLKDDEDLNLIAQIQQQTTPVKPLLDSDGNGRVWLTLELDEEYNHCFRVESYDSTKDNFRSFLNGTLLMDFYNDCIQSLIDFVKEKFTPVIFKLTEQSLENLSNEGIPDDTLGSLKPIKDQEFTNEIEFLNALENYMGSEQTVKYKELILKHASTASPVTTFLNLLWQFANPENGRYIFLSRKEHEILQGFYEDLKDLLQSKTYCGMFDNARPFPETYPFADSRLSTIFGPNFLQSKGDFHHRLRIDPTGKTAYTMGTDNTIHVYDLDQERMVAELSFPGEKDVKIQDVACSADSKQLYAVATVQGKNTIFAIADIEGLNYKWHSVTVICGLQLVTLATAPSLSQHLYAIGKGTGLFKIDPDNLQDFVLHPTPLGGVFNAVGHLVIVEDREHVMAFATDRQENIKPDLYDSVRRINLSTAQAPVSFRLQINAQGTTQTFSSDDDIALVRNQQATIDKLYVVVNPIENQEKKRIFVFNNANSSESKLQPDTIIDVEQTVATTEIRLAYNSKTGYLLLSCGDSFCIRLVDVQKDAIVPEYRHPVQIFPLALAISSKTERVYALNMFSSTINPIPAERLKPINQLDLYALVEYRIAILDAFTDLLGGFLQYAKDSFCSLFLVNCPECGAEEKIYLAGISIKKFKVDHICNFSRRRYVKSFPTVAYWLSVVPIMPLLKYGFKTLCCAILPDIFSLFQMANHTTPLTHATGKQMQYGLQFIKKQDMRVYLQANADKIQAVQKLVRDWAGNLVFNPPKEPPKPDVKQRDIVNQPIPDVRRRLEQSDIVVKKVETYNPALGQKNLLRFTQAPVNLAPGSQVILCEEQGVVRYYAIAEEPPEALQEIQTELADQKSAVDNKVSTLHQQVISQLADQKSAVDNKVSTLQKQVNSQLADQKSAVDNKVSTLQQQMTLQSTLLTELQISTQTIQVQSQEILNLKTTLQSVRTNLENVEAASQQAIMERDQKILNLQTSLQSLQTNFDKTSISSQQAITAQVQEIQTLQKTLEVLHTDVKGIEQLREEVNLLKQRPRGQKRKDEGAR